MHCSYSDDNEPGGINGDLVTAKLLHREGVTVDKTEFKMVVELMGSEFGRHCHRPCGLDLVIVLDVSGSMKGIKMEKLKSAMKFLINKLSPIDRLSVVTFSKRVTRLCSLLSMTEVDRSSVEQLVDGLRAGGGTNITGGLQMALEILHERRLNAGRTSAVMLLCDGQQSSGYGDPTEVQLGHVPVHTFGLGDDHDAKVLKVIAERSKNGTYSVVDDEGLNEANLSVAFSTCLAGLLTEIVQDLELTISSDMDIKMVCAGTYPQCRKDGSITISFGNLYGSEKRRILVYLRLPAAHYPSYVNILKIRYSFRGSGQDTLYESPSIYGTVSRTDSALSTECEDVIMEEARKETVAKIAEALVLSTQYRFFFVANNKLIEADTALDGSFHNDGNEMITVLKYEVEELRKLLRNKDWFDRRGYAFGLATEHSHNLQRFAVRGEAEMKLVAYATPLAFVLAQQAREFDKDPNIPVSTIEQDMEEYSKPDVSYKTALAKAGSEKTEVRHKAVSAKTRDEKSDTSDKAVLYKAGDEGPELSDKAFSAKAALSKTGDGKPDISGKAVTAKAGDKKPVEEAHGLENHLFEKVEKISNYAEILRNHFERVTRCVKALLSMASAIQALIIGALMFWAYIKQFLDK